MTLNPYNKHIHEVAKGITRRTIIKKKNGNEVSNDDLNTIAAAIAENYQMVDNFTFLGKHQVAIY